MNKQEKSVDVFSLRQTDYKDYDAIVNAISKDGEYFTFFARGIRKPTSKNASALQPFVLSNVQYFKSNKDMYLLKSAAPIKNYYEDFHDYDQMIAAHIIAEVIGDISNLLNETNKDIYNLLIDSLYYVKSIDIKLLLSSFLSQVMKQIGLQLVCDECAVCGSKQINYISLEHGGFICHHCLIDNNKAIYSLDILKMFRLIHKVSYEDLENVECEHEVLDDLLMIMYEFYVSYSGLRIKNINHFIQNDVVKSY